MNPQIPRAVRWLIVLAVLIVGLGIGALIFGGGDEQSQPPPATVQLPEQPVGDLEAADTMAEGAGQVTPPDSILRDESPEGVPQERLRTGKDRVDGLVPVEPKPIGGAQNYEVQKDFSGHVYSSRNGARILNFIVHCTVSPNVNGWGDIYGVRDYFKRTRVGSATFIADFEGHVLQMVPLSEKPWTTGFFNPWSITVEIISTCAESRAQWMASDLIRKGVLAELMRDYMRAYSIPFVRVDPIACTVPAGYFDHAHAECGNFHTDISYGCRSIAGQPTYTACAFPWEVLHRQLLEGVCDAVCKQRKVVHGRDVKHRATHGELHRLRFPDGGRCRERIHSHPLSDFRRPECRRLKRRDVRQRDGERRARAELARRRA